MTYRSMESLIRDIMEKKLTPAEKKKREEVAQAIERENPDMPMDQKMAIATATAKKVAEEVEEIEEATPSAKQVKQAIGIARDKRYAGGNMTGAVKTMDKINKGLAQHPAVKKELQKQNEEVDLPEDIASILESVELDEAVSVKKQNYSWGKMVTVHHGSENSYPLHPEHQEKIAKLKHDEKTTFKDETGRHVTAHRDGDKIHLSGAGSNKKTTVAHSHFTEEVEVKLDEVSADVAKRVAQARDKSAEKYKLTPTQSRRLGMGDKGGEPDLNAAKALKSAMKRGAKNVYGEELERTADEKMVKVKTADGKVVMRKQRPEIKIETKAAPKGYHFTKDGKLKRGDADTDGPGGEKLRADPLDKQRSKIPPVTE